MSDNKLKPFKVNPKAPRCLWNGQIAFLDYTDCDIADITFFDGLLYQVATVPFKELKIPNPLFKNSKPNKKKKMPLTKQEILEIIKDAPRA